MNEKVLGVVPLEVARTMSGLDLMRGMIAGRFPAAPIMRTLGFALAQVEDGFAGFEGTPTYELYNPLGGVHGGWIATLLDSCMSCAVHTKLPAGTGYTTLEMNRPRPVGQDRSGAGRRPRHLLRQSHRHRGGKAARCGRQGARARHHDLPDFSAVA